MVAAVWPAAICPLWVSPCATFVNLSVLICFPRGPRASGPGDRWRIQLATRGGNGHSDLHGLVDKRLNAVRVAIDANIVGDSLERLPRDEMGSGPGMEDADGRFLRSI